MHSMQLDHTQKYRHGKNQYVQLPSIYLSIDIETRLLLLSLSLSVSSKSASRNQDVGSMQTVFLWRSLPSVSSLCVDTIKSLSMSSSRSRFAPLWVAIAWSKGSKYSLRGEVCRTASAISFTLLLSSPCPRKNEIQNTHTSPQPHATFA